MAALTAEGTLWIDLVDVYQWIESMKIKTEGAKSLRFDVENDELVLEYTDGKVSTIPSEDMWRWVCERQLPAGIKHYETVFGVPVIESPDLRITFATGSESDPRSWATPPACLAEWKAAKEAARAAR